METHEEWIRRIDAELEGELSLAERALLARHLLGCASCAAARASHLELRVALAKSAGDPHARIVPRPVIRGGRWRSGYCWGFWPGSPGAGSATSAGAVRA